MYNFKSDNHLIVFPAMTDDQNQEDREIISIFLYYYRDVGVMRAEGRVLSAIQKAAVLTGNSDGVIAKILIENGLRASRRSLPQEFLDFIDQVALKKASHPVSSLPCYYEDLRSFWLECGESPMSFMHSFVTDRALETSIMTV